MHLGNCFATVNYAYPANRKKTVLFAISFVSVDQFYQFFRHYNHKQVVGGRPPRYAPVPLRLARLAPPSRPSRLQTAT